MGAAVPTGNGSEVEITVRPVDALARVNDALWERLDAFNAGYTGDTSTDEGYAAYDAAWAEDARRSWPRRSICQGRSAP